MQHRGRHRRRRRGRVLRASLAGTALALTAAATLISTSQAAGGETPGALSSITSAAELGRLQLRETLTDSTGLNTLAREMGGGVGVDEVLRSANHAMRNEGDCFSTEKDNLPVEPVTSRAYCWEPGDAVNDRWVPGSVTTSRNNRVIAAGWTHSDVGSGTPGADSTKAGTTGADHTGAGNTGADGTDVGAVDDEGLARVAFVDASDPANLRYRWVLLVVPTTGGQGFEGLRSRLGGMAWYEDKLIVTARGPQSRGQRDDSLYVFDLARFLRADVTDSDAIGRVGDGWSAHHYRYALPAVAAYSPPAGRGCDARDNDSVPCFGSLSLDRTSTPPTVVANERFRPGRDEPARVWRYALDITADRTGLLTTTGRESAAVATEAYETEATGVQGVLAHKGNWYVDQAAEESDRHGTLWRQDEDGSEAARCAPDKADQKSDLRSYACWGRHTASLSYSPETGEVWTLTDPIPERVLYAVKLSDVDGALD
ncbi:hypothetical protein PV728_01080 [Streptomyces europaeiscabiei]|uniref:hypothetical protein n=1 Tax=Streptomyces europaeiscabiei TaxID=146819 RepID=UPI0029B8EEC8|nr:hypothetical protein [Streptomyces europaeiscabiei]MDX3628925.1 hypothetical protein [Streptomyces europaeiscabiei]MDX3647457.1 hypothetical protein [Streptomyces europaeiscabiei]